MKMKTIWLCIGVFVSLFIMTMGVISAQDSTVTDDQVNAIAKKLYCPVCENIPLDTCPTAACKDWRYEIRIQLEAGVTEQEIIDDFVVRFGDRVVGTPQDPLLRAISLVTPWVITLLATIGVIYALFKLRRNQPEPLIDTDAIPDDNGKSKNRYEDLLEQDLSG